MHDPEAPGGEPQPPVGQNREPPLLPASSQRPPPPLRSTWFGRCGQRFPGRLCSAAVRTHPRPCVFADQRPPGRPGSSSPLRNAPRAGAGFHPRPRHPEALGNRPLLLSRIRRRCRLRRSPLHFVQRQIIATPQIPDPTVIRLHPTCARLNHGTSAEATPAHQDSPCA